MKKKITVLFFLVTTVVVSCNKGNNTDNSSQQQPSIRIDDISLNEGSSGTTNFEFTVTLSNAYSKVVGVHYSTIDGTAKSGEDYTAVSDQVVTFQPGKTQKKIVINVVADDIKEGDDTFSVRLSSPENATLLRQSAVGTIRNDDSKVHST